MLTKVHKWGNSQGVRIPKKLLEHSMIKIGDEVDLTAQNGKIILESTQKIHGKYQIRNLADKMPADYQAGEEDWGTPIGLETW